MCHSHDIISRTKKKLFLTRPAVNTAVIKTISNELDITIHVIASHLSRYCDVINNQLWTHHQNEDRASETTRRRCIKIVVFIVILDSLCHVRNKITYVLSWRTVSVLTLRVILCLSPSLLRNKHKDNPLVNAEFVRRSSTYLIICIQLSCKYQRGYSLYSCRHLSFKTTNGWQILKGKQWNNLTSNE